MYCGLQFPSSLGALGDHFGIILGSSRVHFAQFLDYGAPSWHPRTQTWGLRSKRGAQVAPKGVLRSRGCASCSQIGAEMGGKCVEICTCTHISAYCFPPLCFGGNQ